MKSEILKSKTFITSVFTVGVGIAKAIGLEVPAGLIEGLLGLTAIFMRMGIKKAE